MITLMEAIKLANYHITGGSRYCWECFGPNARYIDFMEDSKISFSVIFDTVTQTVYEAVISDYERENHYRIIHPDYIDEYRNECESRNAIWNQVYDDVTYVDLECVDDFIEKATAIVNGKEYDDRVSVPLDLSDEEFIEIAMAAHKLDITINQYVEKAIQNMIETENF